MQGPAHVSANSRAVRSDTLLQAVASGQSGVVADLLGRCRTAGWPISLAACLYAAVKAHQVREG